MLDFTTAPPSNPEGQPLPVRRVPAAGAIVATITSQKMLGTYTHFWGNRTVPCTHDACEACANGCPFRWHAYVSAYEFTKNLHFIFECTAAAAAAFVTYAHDHGTLRGCVFRATRDGKRPNGRVVIETHPYPGKPQDLPPEPSLVIALSRLWNIPTAEISTPETRQIQQAIRVGSNAPQKHLTPQPTRGNGEEN